MNREKFRHGRYEVEQGGDGRFYVTDLRHASDEPTLIIDISNEGADVTPFDHGSLHFGGASEFDELRDLITFLRGKAAEASRTTADR